MTDTVHSDLAGHSASGAPNTARARQDGIAFLAPLLLLVLIVFDIPLLITVYWSFADPDTGALTLGNYGAFVQSGSYARIIWRTLLIAGQVTVATALIGYPLAYWISRLEQRRQLLAIGIVTMTFWVSILVRTYAWIVILGNGGILNRWLQASGFTTKPIEFIYNEGGVAVGMINVLLPFFVLPLYAAMRRIDVRLMQVAETMGASPTQIFWRVFFPLTLPALGASMILIFILSLGFYITPAILGGGRVPMIANMMDLLINKFARWEMAAVNSVVLLLATLALYAVYQKLRERT
ncbi:MAG: ABC transporter permease [Hyphomicrobiales bacterium]